MKKLLIASALMLTVVGTASAKIPSISSTNLQVVVKNGTATVSGHAEDGIERKMAVSYANKLEGVDKVIDLSTHN
ncbi:MAG: BON domain-containing protein [Granulosicoccus sp.]|nr:BON domain-containing protein [Granulosicoccus sp.]